MRPIITVAFLLLSLGSQILSAEQVSLPHQGLTLHANLSAAGDNGMKGPVVVMTHGTLAHNDMEIIKGLQDMLADRGISTLAINLSLGLDKRPSAMYDCPTPHRHKHTDALDEIGAWVDWLKAKGARNLALLGHSRGGNQTAWYAAERHDPIISHVFLIAPSTWSEDSAAKDYEKRYGKPLLPALKQAQDLVAAGKPQSMMKPLGFIYCEDTQATAEAFVSYYAPDPRQDSAALIPRIQAPVIVFAGSDDKVVVGLIEQVKPLADGERIRLEVADGADHFFRDLYSEDIADIIAETLGE